MYTEIKPNQNGASSRGNISLIETINSI